MSTASGVRRIIDALSKTKPPKLPVTSVSRFDNDTELLTIGIIVGITVAAFYLLWITSRE